MGFEGNSMIIRFDLSEQEVVSCARMNGCLGGYPLDALNYFKEAGVTDERCYWIS